MKFTLRDLLLATFVSALAVGWWTDRGHQLTKIAEQQHALGDRETTVKVQQVKIDQLGERIRRMKEVMDLWASLSEGCKLAPAANVPKTIDPFAPLPPRSPEEPKE